ncbi:MAG: ATP-binding cassette domain-containing protein [Chloroflexi bacterium]|nr:MAG: ATP-binding cassette domain-containing protein [Chloroflexota bacterium]
MNTVVINQVSKRFGDTIAVDNVSFHVAPGEIFGLLGPNGAGKTTTIRMMLGILQPDSGYIEVFGGPMTEEKKNRVGYLPEERGLYADLKLMDVILYLASLKGMSRKTAVSRAETYLKQLDLWEHRHKKLNALSRGMHQKAQFIVTVLHDPDLIIVDEPFSGLDPVNTQLIKNMLLDMRTQGKSIIMSTHQMHQVETMCDRIVLINRGRVMLEGEVKEVRRRFAGNTIEVSGNGSFAHLPHVIHAEQHNGIWHLALDETTTPHNFLRELMHQDDIEIEHFSIALPSLNEIFIRIVGENTEVNQ